VILKDVRGNNKDTKFYRKNNQNDKYREIDIMFFESLLSLIRLISFVIYVFIHLFCFLLVVFPKKCNLVEYFLMTYDRT